LFSCIADRCFFCFTSTTTACCTSFSQDGDALVYSWGGDAASGGWGDVVDGGGGDGDGD